MTNNMAKKKKLAKPKPGASTQNYLDIAEIRENSIILKDGTLRSVIMVSSINFALKSSDEQSAMVQSYMQFLNGLEHPIQVVIQSRKMNIESYINELDRQEATISNDLLRSQIRDYRSFIVDLVEIGEIMQKRFYVVVPYDPAGGSSKSGFFAKLSEALTPAARVKLSKKQFEDRRDALRQRTLLIHSGLTGLGLNAVTLDTQGLIELFYTIYNPEVYDTQRLGDLSQVQLEEGFN